ncbi:PIN domain-containing protein [Candidatus Woesearchaeota archaeon]|nr:PIN domain-containing protein [Candidatus Woesearchaeota archaeon]
MVLRYFLDTYAFIEIIKGNPNYDKYVECECYTTILNLYELYYQLLKSYGQEAADSYYSKYLSLKLEIKEEYIPKSALFRLNHKQQNVSYVDALGYTIALENGLIFLTGDKEFKNLPNVVFEK